MASQKTAYELKHGVDSVQLMVRGKLRTFTAGQTYTDELLAGHPHFKRAEPRQKPTDDKKGDR